MRNLIVWLHRWVALVLGAFIVLISVSGSLIVIAGPIDRALDGDIFNATIPASGPVRLPLDSILASARTRGEVVSLTLPEGEGRVVVASMTGGDEVFVSPYTGDVLGSRTPQQRNAGIIRLFFRVNGAIHTSLLGKAIGNQVVVWSTIASVFLVLGGIYLWWRDKVWRIQVAASWKRINFDLHHLLGIATFVVLFLMTATGVAMHYPIIGRAIGRLDRFSDPAPAPMRQSQPAPGTPTVSLEVAAGAGLAALPGSELSTISVPADAKRPISLVLRFPENFTRGRDSRVYVDRWTGAILFAQDSRTAGIGTKLNNLTGPLHTGNVFGAPTRVIWFLGCWVLVAQAVTGFLMWWHARPARQAEAARKLKAAAA
jgi:uncharacterized iron-regulated membrane protein